MKWWQSLFSSGIDKVVSSVGEAVDRLVTSDEERLILKNELVLIEAKVKLDGMKMELEAEANLEKEITDRWQADNNQEDPMAKRVRPFSLVYLLGFMSVIIIGDSTAFFDFDVKETYIELIQTLLVTVFVAYFGSRGLEKSIAIFRK